jgi:hypothetical protein
MGAANALVALNSLRIAWRILSAFSARRQAVRVVSIIIAFVSIDNKLNCQQHGAANPASLSG